jgi:hypothetical protein
MADPEFAVGHVFAGVDSVALEYRVGDRLHGVEFMTLGADGQVSFRCRQRRAAIRPRLLNSGHKGP